jgi:hypothetical protein
MVTLLATCTTPIVGGSDRLSTRANALGAAEDK